VDTGRKPCFAECQLKGEDEPQEELGGSDG